MIIIINGKTNLNNAKEIFVFFEITLKKKTFESTPFLQEDIFFSLERLNKKGIKKKKEEYPNHREIKQKLRSRYTLFLLID